MHVMQFASAGELNLLISICWLVFIAVWVVSAFGAKRTVGGGGFGEWAGIRIVVFGIIIFLFLDTPAAMYFRAYEGALEKMPLLGLLGVVLCALGIALAIWARFYLGRNWGMPRTLKENPGLVTSGPYAYVRHPIYSGFILAAIGSAVVNPAWIIPFLFFSVYFVWSATREEKLMLKEFPDQYPAYMQRTKMLVPFIF